MVGKKQDLNRSKSTQIPRAMRANCDYAYVSAGDRVHIVRANAAGYVLRNMSNMSDNVLHRYVGIRERIGNRSTYGQRDGPKTNVSIISRGGLYTTAAWSSIHSKTV